MMMTTSPCAVSSPAAIATSLPKLRDSESARTRGSIELSLRISLMQASTLPSSTNRISHSGASRVSIGVSRVTSGARFSASLKTGMTIDSRREFRASLIR